MTDVRLNRRMTLEALDRRPDGTGGFNESWRALGTLWAEMRPRTGRRASGEETPVSEMDYRIIVRAAPAGAPSRPRPGQRLRTGSRFFRILAVAEHDRLARYLTCFAHEEVAP